MIGESWKVTNLGALWLSVSLLAGQVTTVMSQTSVLDEVFTATNHVGMVCTDARILSIAAHRVLVISREGLGVLSDTNLPSGMRKEVLSIEVWRENLLTEEGTPRHPKFYMDGILKHWSNKSELEKIKDFQPIIDFCLAEKARFEPELARIEATATGANDAAAVEVLVRLGALADQRDTEAAICEGRFGRGQITPGEREQQLLTIKQSYLAGYKKVTGQFGREKWRVEERRMALKGDVYELRALINILHLERDQTLRNVYFTILRKVLTALNAVVP